MKFGVEFSSRSISRWRNYNIDYNLLKSLIREATTEFEEDESYNSSSDNTSSDTGLNDHQKKLLKKLYKNFKEQIGFVSLFVFSKVGEISRRLSTLKRQCNLFIETEAIEEHNSHSAISMRIRKRKLHSFHKELDLITDELQDLSRFILLQKIAIKKLLKKFVKYSSNPQKQSFVDKITNDFLIANPKSFIHLNLDELTQETTLLYDFLDTFLTDYIANNNITTDLRRDRQSSIHTIDSLQLTTQSYKFPHSKHIDTDNSQIFPRSSTFDIVSKRKGPRSLTFWVHVDNLDEIKFFLSSEFKLITDDSLFTNDVKLKNTKSSLNLNDTSTNIENNTEIINKISNKHNTSFGANDDFRPETETLSIWLNNPINPLFIQSVPLDTFDYEISSIDNLHIFNSNPYSQILVSNLANNNGNKDSILFAPIGGLRQFAISSINKHLVDLLFYNNKLNLSNNEKKDLLYEEWKKSGLKGNKQMSQLSFDWVIDNNVKPLAKVESKKLRYINLNSNEKINFYISLEWDINLHKTNDDGTENSNVDIFPHAILEIDFDIPESDFPASIQTLINSYFVYRVDDLNFSLNNYLIYNYINNTKDSLISDDEMLLFIAPWHDVLTNKDIRILPEMRSKSHSSVAFQSSRSKSGIGSLNCNVHKEEEHDDDDDDDEGLCNNGILLNKDEIVPRKPGYWNEFDNGSEYGGDDSFYVYLGNDNNNTGFLNWFSKLFTSNTESNTITDDMDIEENLTPFSNWSSVENTDKIINWVNNNKNLGQWLGGKILGIDHARDQSSNMDETRLLLPRTKRKLSRNIYTVDEDDESDSETEAMMQLPDNKRYVSINSRNYSMVYMRNDNHDKTLSFIYMVMVMFSLITSSIGTFIIFTIFNKNVSKRPQMTTGITVLVIFAIFCLVISFLLAGISICLFLCRFTPPPMWHMTTVWIGSALSTLFFFYGITLCF